MATGVSRAFDLASEVGFVYGRSEAIQAVNAIVAEIARTDIPVLLQGESGTGKEVYARLIHQLSTQKQAAPFKLHCTVLEPALLLARLNTAFGNWQEESRESEGVLFLDGIDELDLDCQKVLLAMLQERETESGGRMGFRLISTSTRSLDQEIEMGRFRRELYFRINGVCVQLPALRERKADIPLFMEYFLEKHAAEAGKRTPVLSADESEILQAYHWLGNIRELGNLTRKMVALGEAQAILGELRRQATPRTKTAEIATSASLKVLARAATQRVERDLILKALERTHWNRKRAAQELQISYKSLLHKIKQTGVEGKKADKE